MKRYFQGIPIDCWVHPGQLGRRRSCICVRAAAEGAKAFAMALDEISQEPAPASRTLTLAPEQLGTFRRFKIRLVPTTADLKMFCISVENAVPILEVTPGGLPEVLAAVQAWMDGAEDFRLHTAAKVLGKKDKDSEELWFWVTMMP
jgi:hypothetical protein